MDTFKQQTSFFSSHFERSRSAARQVLLGQFVQAAAIEAGVVAGVHDGDGKGQQSIHRRAVVFDGRLRQLKSKPRGKQNSHRLFYLYKDVRINIVFEDFKPEGAEIPEGDPMFKMKITLRKRSSVRTIQAVGSSDC